MKLKIFVSIVSRDLVVFHMDHLLMVLKFGFYEFFFRLCRLWSLVVNFIYFPRKFFIALHGTREVCI